MVGKTKINIFKNMTEKELDDELHKKHYDVRYYQRLVAMKIFSEINNQSKVAKLIGRSYDSVHRWAQDCEAYGLEGLRPNFNGGRPPLLNEDDEKRLKELIIANLPMSKTDVKRLISDEFDIEFSLPHVCTILKKLDFNYGKPRPRFYDSPEDKEEIYKKN